MGQGTEAVDTNSGANCGDRTLDPVWPTPVLRRDEIDLYQCLVVNPFLTILGWCLIGLLQTEAVSRLIAIGPTLTIPAYAICFFLLQYHCLDCGTTGWLRKRGSHTCSGVLSRQRTGRAGPRIFAPDVQGRIWFWLLGASCIAFLIFSHR